MDKGTNPHISVDCVIFGFDFEKLNVLLLERCMKDSSENIIMSDRSLVGNHIGVNESLDAAASRILKETTGLTDIYLEQFYTFGSPDRLSKARDMEWRKSIGHNPDERVLTVGYFSLVNSKQVEIMPALRHADWCEVNKVGNLAFDHNQILTKGLEALRVKTKLAPIAFELLPQKFTLSQLHKLYEAIFDTEIDKRNFWKKAQQMPYIVSINEKQKDASRKPAKLFMFSRDIYENTKKERIGFFV